MSEWQYRIVTIDTQHEPNTLEWIQGFEEGSPEVQKLLDSMSREGWELVAFFPARPANYVVENSVTGQRLEWGANPWLYNAIFKKEKESKSLEQQAIENSIERHRKKTGRK
jgi:hypothetical protein